MRTLLTTSFALLALAALGCQQSTPPPATPQTAPAPPPPPGPHDGHGMSPPGPHAHDGRGRHDKQMARRGHDGHGRNGRHGRAGGAHGAMGPMPGGPPHGMPHTMPEMPELAMLGVHMMPPPMLLAHAKAIGLSSEQVSKIRDEVVTTHKKAIDLRAKSERASLEAARLLAADKVDERAVGAQIDEAAKARAEMAKLHVGLMLRVRGLLTPEQRQKLEEMKPPGHPGGPHPGMGPMSHADDDDDDEDDDD